MCAELRCVLRNKVLLGFLRHSASMDNNELANLADSDPGALLAVMQQELKELRRFVTRRFDEVSFEINATGQMLGMNEEAMTSRFSEVLALLNAVSFRGDGATPHNVGVELDAVVRTTEEAANRIMDAATTISEMTRQPVSWSDEAARNAWLQKIEQQATHILTACSFQDLTGQRIARTLENIRQAEADLSDTLQRMGIRVEDAAQTKAAAMIGKPEERVQSQGDIDALFA